MEATRKNRRIAKQIMELLAREGCTVRQAEEILACVGRAARDTATVQFTEQLSEPLDPIERSTKGVSHP